MLLERVLHRAGFDVLSAGCGGEAISISQSHPGEIALLITDITLPGMNGWTLARKLMQADPDISVLYMSGGCVEWNLDDDEHVEFLPKPFSLSTLLMEVNYLLTERPANEVS
jgi:two-component system cell cycle sensor histidine kinase/response regulator CckA